MSVPALVQRRVSVLMCLGLAAVVAAYLVQRSRGPTAAMAPAAGARRYLRPSWFVRAVANPLIARLGLLPVLAVRGRQTGRWRTAPVNVLELSGVQYLVAPRGETQWVRNLRANPEGELRRWGRVRPFRAVEVPDAEKPPLLQAYLDRWGFEVTRYFGALPDPADHPVFRLEPAGAVQRTQTT